MEIHNNLQPIVKDNVSNKKKSSLKQLKNKTIEADSLTALASYGMAQVNSCSFKGKIEPQKINVPKESRLNIINLLGITDKDEIKRLLNFTGFQFSLVSAFLYLGEDVDSAEKELDFKIEDILEEGNEELVEVINKSKDFLINDPQSVIDFIRYMQKKNINLDDKYNAALLLMTLNQNSLPLAKELSDDESKKYDTNQLADIFSVYTEETKDFIKKILNESDEKFSTDDKILIIRAVTPENLEIAEQLTDKNNSRFQSQQIQSILLGTKKDTINFVKKVLSDKSLDYDEEDLSKIIRTFNKENLAAAQELLYNQNSGYNTDEISEILSFINKENKSLAMDLITDVSDKRFEHKDIARILYAAKGTTFYFVENFIKHNDSYDSQGKTKILYGLNYKNVNLAQRMINLKKDKRLNADTIANILMGVSFDNLKIDMANYLIDLYEKDEIKLEDYVNIINFAAEDTWELIKKMLDMPKEKRCSSPVMCNIVQAANIYNFGTADNNPKNKLKMEFAKYLVDLANNGVIDLKYYGKIVEDVEEGTVELIKKMLEAPSDKRYSYNEMHEIVFSVKDYSDFRSNDWKKPIVNEDKLKFAMLFAQNSFGFDQYMLRYLISDSDKETREFITDIIQSFDKILTNEEIKNVIDKYLSYENSAEKKAELQKLVDLLKKEEIPKCYMFNIINTNGETVVTIEEVRQLEQLMGKENVKTLSEDEMVFALQFKDICNIENINEIPIHRKKDVLRKLVASNTGLFDVSDNLRKFFPLVPKTQEEYCTLLPALVRSLGIETNTLSDNEKEKFNTSLQRLGDTLKNITDDDFLNIKITQEYPKSEFINDTYNIVKDLSSQERQKVYDYFGFELKYNEKGTRAGEYSIIGYPANLNNGKKLAQITNADTKAVVEKLREKVIKFSQNNKVICNNPVLEDELNNIISVFPELRTQIDKVQHGAHKYDIMKHSLKVLQKILQNPEYEKLSEQDKHIMLISALFHDGNKAEGIRDKLHAEESAFDAYYIINKLDLPKEEKIKIYSLIKHHEWLGYVNDDVHYKLPVEKKQQSVAFDLQYDNLFDMAKIFTLADLKSVKTNDSFYLDYKQDFERHSKSIENYINELKKSQPLLPVTKIPQASRINEAITKVNEDGSTNIKGVYKNKDGMIIIKFNEVENDSWEKIGFPKGSVSKGITAKGISDQPHSREEVDVDTGNIKFFVHGLDFSNQLAKFDAFALPDSEALLSVSYTERPESKYRFFRPQGVLLETDTKYIHGGGNTDAGSGRGKEIQDFKDNYIFGGKKESDRTYVSDLLKEALNLTDEEYIEFIKQNADKSLTEIKPEEIADKIIKALATINSNTRKGNRAYNEMYISNPRVMGVFAYSKDNNVGDIMQFIDNQPEFLKQYALEKDLPFIVFGD